MIWIKNLKRRVINLNKLKLKEYSVDKLIYLYQPEGTGEYGEIMYSIETGKTEVLKRSSNDESGRYSRMAEKKVRDCYNTNNLPLECIQAWY